MQEARLGWGLTMQVWRSPAGLLLGFFCLLSSSLLGLFAPTAAATDPSGAAGVVPLAVLLGSALMLVGLDRRRAFLELMGPTRRSRVELGSLALLSTQAVALSCLPAWLVATPQFGLVGAGVMAGIHMAGLALPVSVTRATPATKVGLLVALGWWVPSLALADGSWQGGLKSVLSPLAAHLGSTSENNPPGAMLQSALLAVAVALAGFLTARIVTRIE